MAILFDITKDFLIQKNHIENMLVKDIAALLKCNRRTVSLAFKKHGIESIKRTPDNRGRLFSEETKKKQSLGKLGNKNPQYKNGTADCGKGYTLILKPGGGYIREHILIMESLIGRKLNNNQIVHHIDENRKNNKPDNLQLMTRSEHIRHHNLETIKKDPQRRYFGINQKMGVGY